MALLATRALCSQKMAAMELVLVLLISAASSGLVHGQPSTNGFISISCGTPDSNSYKDRTTGLEYTSDTRYITSEGSPGHIDVQDRASQNVQPLLQTLRSFPQASTSCYNLPVKRGSKYLARAMFLYGNYDRQDKVNGNTKIQFDLLLGDDFQDKVLIRTKWGPETKEVMSVALDDTLRVCLVDTGSGTPFINALELRPLKDTLYPIIDASLSLGVAIRRAASMVPSPIRYPDDPYDRIWVPFPGNSSWGNFSITSQIQKPADGRFEVPSKVMQYAIGPLQNSSTLLFTVTWGNTGNENLLVALHFADNSSGLRTFDILYNQQRWWNQSISLTQQPISVFNDTPFFSPSGYNFTFIATKNSANPPILNAMEIFRVMRKQHQGRRQRKTALIIVICVTALLALLIMSAAIWRLRRKKLVKQTGTKVERDLPHVDCRQFTYLELNTITNNFEKEIGRGGFGTVYLGCLEDETQVAVKIRPQSSSQGSDDFLAEAHFLARVHHRRLVSIIGYCVDEDCVALIFEYMDEGCLQNRLNAENDVLTWQQRLRISLESAQGLEYLHSGCWPAIIHRDVKTSNILLNKKLEAKLADLGISRSLPNDDLTHITTAVVGTHGYLDPEYYNTKRLNEKSDVYSFGVVLLEIITGRSAILIEESCHIAQWVMSLITRGEIDEVVDPKLQGNYQPNSAWKIVDIAMKCTLPSSVQRPTMADVVVQLKECLKLEAIHDSDTMNSFTGGLNNAHGRLRSGSPSDSLLLSVPSPR